MRSNEKTDMALVLSGGVALGAYQGGVYEALHNAYRTAWIAGSSVGAANAAIIAGNKPEDRVDRLRDFWMDGSLLHPFTSLSGPLRHLQNWSSVLQTRLFGAHGHFRPRTAAYNASSFQSFYSLLPMRTRLQKLVDFDRLNDGDVRITIVATDVETGEMVTFDTARGARLELDHVLASCGYLPEFAPIEIGGRLLGDGGLSSNAPVEVIIEDEDPPPIIYLADLFSRDGERPTSLETALERKSDLLFANQTYSKLEAFRRLARHEIGERSRPKIVHLSYRAPRHEAGSEKAFDYSRSTLQDRWLAGKMDCEEAERRLSAQMSDPVISIRRPQEGSAA
jgi:NTE family protein